MIGHFERQESNEKNSGSKEMIYQIESTDSLKAANLMTMMTTIVVASPSWYPPWDFLY